MITHIFRKLVLCQNLNFILSETSGLLMSHLMWPELNLRLWDCIIYFHDIFFIIPRMFLILA